MARINLDDSIFKENGFQDLMIYLGCRHKAKGVVWELYELAQKFWFPERRAIPVEVFDARGLPEILYAKGGLALLREDGVYARGSEERFAWLFEKAEAGRKGGIASAESRKNKTGTAQPTNVKKPKQRRSSAEAESSTPKHDQASYLFSLSSYLLSPNSKLKTPISEPDAARLYQLCLEAYPVKVAGPKAWERFTQQIKTHEDGSELAQALTHYLTMLALPENHWRRAKQTFEAFLGTKASGLFWREFISPESCKPTTSGKQELSDEEFAAQLIKKHGVGA